MNPEREKKQREAYACALGTVLLWSTVASAFKLSLRYLNYAELLMYSSLVSTTILAMVILATGKIRQVLSCTGRQWMRSFLLGLLNPFLYYLVLFKAYELLPAQQAQPINYTWALTLAILSVPLLGQRIGTGDFLGLFVGYFGVLIISTEGHFLDFRLSNPAGVALALASTVIWALYWIYSTKDTRPPVVCLFQNFVCGLVPVSMYYLIVSGFRMPGLQGLIGATYVGAFEMSITFILWLRALRLSENTAKVGSLIFLSPCISLLLIHFVVGEVIRGSTVIGLALILSGFLIQKRIK
jgi:drug/metabolite transporter (DMT)-like permease